MTDFDLPEECPHCGSDNSFEHTDGYGFVWRECRACGCEWAHEDPPLENDETMYEEPLL